MRLQMHRTICANLLLLTLVLLALPASPAHAQATKVEDLKYPPLPPFEIPQPTRVELSNGMVLLLLEDHEVPLVEVTARIYTGSRLEPADKVGLAELTGTVLRTGGTTSKTGDELDDYLEAKAAVIETFIGATWGGASMSCLAGDFGDVLRVFADVLRNPIFDQDKLVVAKTAAEAQIARQNDNPQQILFRELNEIVYGSDSPYTRDTTYESLGNITREDLLAWHRQYYHPNRVIVGLVGDFDTKAALREVEKAFGDWPKGAEPTAADVPYNREPRPGVFYVEKNDMTQSNIAMAHLGIRRDNPDYYAIEVMNQVMSGSFASRLFSRVRSQQGLAYAVFGQVGAAWDYDGLTFMGMTTKTESTGAGIEALLREAHNMVDEPPTEGEVQKAKDSILNSFIFNSDSRRKILSQQLTYEYYGYPLDWLSRYRTKIEGVTTEQVRQVAERYLHPDRFSILVVGPAEGRDKPLSTYGEVTEVDITIPEPPAEKVAVSEEGARRASDLLAETVASLGGGRVDSIDRLRLHGKAVQTTPQGEMEIQLTSTLLLPDRFRQEMTLPFGTVAVVVTPDTAFIESPQGVQDMPDSMRKSTESSLRRNPLALLQARHSDDFAATVVGEDEVDGTPVTLVQVEHGGDVTVLAIDPASGRLLQLRYRGATGMGGAPGDIVQTYSDFRDLGDMSYPFSVVGTFNGEPALALSLEEVELDFEIDDGLFVKPEAPVAAAE